MISLDNSINFDIGIAITGLSISPVFEGPYTELQLRRLVNGRSTTVYFELTGEEVDSLMSDLIDLRNNGNNPIRHRNFIPVTSGFSYKIKDNQDDSYTYLGSDLDKDDKFSKSKLLYDNLVSDIESEIIGFSTLFRLLSSLEDKENSQIKNTLLQVLYLCGNDSFNKAIIDSSTKIKQLEVDGNDIKLFNIGYKITKKSVNSEI